MFDALKRTIRSDFVVIDSQFPQKIPLGFRNIEINEYYKKIKNFGSFTMYPMQPGPEAWFSHSYGVEKYIFEENKQGYLDLYPSNSERIHYLNKNKRYKAKLAYTFFLAETYVLLPFLENNNIPFVFVLYPGGGFGLDNVKSDEMLARIFQSSCFRGVIVTQEVTKKYLLRKELCPKDRIDFIYGGFVQFRKNEVIQKKYYNKDKKSFDICFVAARYSEKGVDKGYDVFIKVAKKICKLTKDVNFHIVGGFDKDEINVKEMGSRIKFYGYQQSDFLLELYSKMDVFLAPNKPFKLYKGNFDGFPLGVDAGFCGVALMVADDLKMNTHYKEGIDFVKVGFDPDKIVSQLLTYYNDVDSLYVISHNGQRKIQKLLDIDLQIQERIKVFSKYTELELSDNKEGI